MPPLSTARERRSEHGATHPQSRPAPLEDADNSIVTPSGAGFPWSFSIGELLLRRGEAQLICNPDQLGQRGDLHLVHDLRPMPLNGNFTGAQRGGDLFVLQPRDN